MSDLSWLRFLPEVGRPILDRLTDIEARERAVAAEALALRRARRALVRDVRVIWSEADVALAYRSAGFATPVLSEAAKRAAAARRAS